jgi:cob(I)alamin adenosyltransferase
MVTLNRIYTRTGDDGTTALGTGERTKKYNLRITAYGTVDEANAAIGMARVHLGSQQPELPELEAMLLRIQNDMFDLGGDLCIPDRGEKLPYEPLRITDAQVVWMEGAIDTLNAHLSPLKSFVLPAGSAGAAALHVARTITRRAERAMVELADQPGEIVSKAAIKYANRLSDFLFVASRFANDKGKADVLWVPGKNR